MKLTGIGVVLAVFLTGCATTTPPYDYTAYRERLPRSILILPPVSESNDVRDSYGYLSTLTEPIAEMGYYVFPVVLVDQTMKENGMSTPRDMRQAPLRKLRELFGADAVLYITLKQYGTRFYLASSVTTVTAHAQLVDLKSETAIWDGNVSAYRRGVDGGQSGMSFTPLHTQPMNSSVFEAPSVAREANLQFRDENRGLLYGPYHPQYSSKK